MKSTKGNKEWFISPSADMSSVVIPSLTWGVVNIRSTTHGIAVKYGVAV